MLLIGTAFVTFDFVQLTFLSEQTWHVDVRDPGPDRDADPPRSVPPPPAQPRRHHAVEFWVWIGAYTVEPIGLLIFAFFQRRMPGTDPLRGMPAPPASFLRTGTIAGWLATVVGAVMFAFPDAAIDVWSWPLTPRTARILGSWLVGAGLVMVVAMWERDRWRLFVPSLAFLALGPVQAIGIVRYADQVDWGNAQVWLHLAFLAVVFALGVGGIVMSSRAPKPFPASVVPPAPVPSV